MEIKGRDIATESYRILHDVDGRDVMALVPERLAASDLTFGARPSHQAAYVWIAANKNKIETAITQLARGTRRPRAPFDEITLIED